ncbi:hypothetical protein BCR33DRAFT_421067 [Rhizoclosmatium globosum]|uniref:Uncharacterized protein n=1 Tax=Rhizoclosmatium globosum TaxID=329046 RepID=A0A1Y2BVK5_9FUNG|nr:hypothetical protein BCR33DRAFT_421067 [Rhizoclosmatium globosum]|eukprot:ORY38789.1 hypothetical protein BCR33DRAFT_421067 [Rhizoclosmatium globosum]
MKVLASLLILPAASRALHIPPNQVPGFQAIQNISGPAGSPQISQSNEFAQGSTLLGTDLLNYLQQKLSPSLISCLNGGVSASSLVSTSTLQSICATLTNAKDDPPSQEILDCIMSRPQDEQTILYNLVYDNSMRTSFTVGCVILGHVGKTAITSSISLISQAPPCLSYCFTNSSAPFTEDGLVYFCHAAMAFTQVKDGILAFPSWISSCLGSRCSDPDNAALAPFLSNRNFSSSLQLACLAEAFPDPFHTWSTRLVNAFIHSTPSDALSRDIVPFVLASILFILIL